MSRLSIETPDRAQQVVDDLCRDMGHRIAANPPGLCPVDMALNFLRLCHAQTCGKCVPCRIGLSQLETLHRERSRPDRPPTAPLISSSPPPPPLPIPPTAPSATRPPPWCCRGSAASGRTTRNTPTTAAASAASTSRCPAWPSARPMWTFPATSPWCGRAAMTTPCDLIRKDNPFPFSCAYVCEHPCERQCRRRMVDDAVNICGLKRFAVDHCRRTAPAALRPCHRQAGGRGGRRSQRPDGSLLSLPDGPQRRRVRAAGKAGRHAALRHPRLPSAPRGAGARILTTFWPAGVEVRTGVCIGKDVQVADLQKDFDAVYVAIGAHADKKLGLRGRGQQGRPLRRGVPAQHAARAMPRTSPASGWWSSAAAT